MNHGLKLKKVHRVIEFEQEAWLKKYIDFNMDLRAKATNDFEKDFLKLINDAVFGKVMENVRKHRNIKLVKTNKKMNKLVSEPNYHTMKLIDEDLALIEMKKVKVVGLMKDQLGGGIINEFVALRPKAYSNRTDDLVELKKAKGTKKCVIKNMLKFEDYKNCLFGNGKVLRSQ